MPCFIYIMRVRLSLEDQYTRPPPLLSNGSQPEIMAKELQTVSKRESMSLPISATVQPRTQARTVPASHNEESKEITLSGSAQGLGSWWPKNKKTKELDAALEGESEFRTWIKDNIDKQDLKFINGIAITTETLDSLDKQTYEMLKENIESFYAAELLGQAGRAKSDLRVKRTKGVKKTTTSFVKFAKTFQDFLKNYSGIVDIMKSANNQYGGMAYGILSLLFSVAANKQGLETALQTAVEDLSTRLEEMAIYQKIYRDASLRALIAKVFKGIIDFSRMAIKYYKKKYGIWRSLRAAIDPHTFDDNVAKTKTLMAAVQMKAGALLAERNERIETVSNNIHSQNKTLEDELKQVKSQNLALQEQLCRMRETKDSEHLTKILECLRTKNYDADEHHKQEEKYRMQLQEFAEDPKRTKMDLETLRKTDQYFNWISSKQSSLLVLSGQNERGIIESRGRCCWLSPAVIDFIDESRQNGRFLLYHLNLRHQNQRDDPTAHDIFISFAAQLLTKRPKLLRDPTEFRRLQSRLQSLDWEDDIEEICDFLIHILNLLEDRSPVEIILDRIDVCSGLISEVMLMNALLRMVRSVNCTVKILVVACSTNWDITKETKSLNTRGLVEGMFATLVRNEELQDCY